MDRCLLIQPLQTVFLTLGCTKSTSTLNFFPNVTELATYHRLVPGFRLLLFRRLAGFAVSPAPADWSVSSHRLFGFACHCSSSFHTHASGQFLPKQYASSCAGIQHSSKVEHYLRLLFWCHSSTPEHLGRHLLLRDHDVLVLGLQLHSRPDQVHDPVVHALPTPASCQVPGGTSFILAVDAFSGIDAGCARPSEGNEAFFKSSTSKMSTTSSASLPSFDTITNTTSESVRV